MPYSFEASGNEAQIFMHNERRFAYATPKSYLELINLYTSMVGKKVDELEDKKDHLANDLDKVFTRFKPYTPPISQHQRGYQLLIYHSITASNAYLQKYFVTSSLIDELVIGSLN